MPTFTATKRHAHYDEKKKKGTAKSFFWRFSYTHPIFSICHSIALFTHAQLLTEYNSNVQSHSPFTTTHILLCQHDFHIKTMFQKHESRTSVKRGLSEMLVILYPSCCSEAIPKKKILSILYVCRMH